jgi:hypothetical protein
MLLCIMLCGHFTHQEPRQSRRQQKVSYSTTAEDVTEPKAWHISAVLGSYPEPKHYSLSWVIVDEFVLIKVWE